MNHGTQFPEQIVLRVSSDLHDKMERIAAQEGRTLANLTRRALEQWASERELAGSEAA
jgi:predicted transcriptional regulator